MTAAADDKVFGYIVRGTPGHRTRPYTTQWYVLRPDGSQVNGLDRWHRGHDTKGGAESFYRRNGWRHVSDPAPEPRDTSLPPLTRGQQQTLRRIVGYGKTPASAMDITAHVLEEHGLIEQIEVEGTTTKWWSPTIDGIEEADVALGEWAA